MPRRRDDIDWPAVARDVALPELTMGEVARRHGLSGRGSVQRGLALRGLWRGRGRDPDIDPELVGVSPEDTACGRARTQRLLREVLAELAAGTGSVDAQGTPQDQPQDRQRYPDGILP